MIYLLLCFYFQVPKELGKVHFIPKLSDKPSITRFISDSKPSVLIFTKNVSNNYDFTNLAIKRFSNNINFAFAIDTNDSLTAEFGIASKTSISIHEFINKKHYASFNGYSNSISFNSWCQEIVGNATNSHILYEFEDLRKVFESRLTYLIGVNHMNPPAGFQNDVRFVAASSRLFVFINKTVQTGYFVYRGIDRQLMRVSNNYRTYIKSALIDMERDDIRKKPYFCGFFIESLNETVASHEISILHQLANKYIDNKNFQFGPMTGSVSSFMASVSRLDFIRKPIFVVWNSTNINGTHRWAIHGKDSHNITKIEAFLSEIVEKKIPFNVISDIPDELNEIKIVTNNFHERIRNERKHTIVLFSVSNGDLNFKYRNLIKHTKALLPEISFLSLDLAMNDFPEGVAMEGQRTPFFNLFRKGDTENPIPLGIGTSMKSFVAEIVEKIDDGTKIPDIDYIALQSLMQKEAQQNRKQG